MNNNSFVIYNASAGSGKTYTLVKQYLLLLFTSQKVDNYKNILAITFTNKAVEEMKTRIVGSLNEFAQTETSEKANALIRDISEETGLSQEDIKRRSQQILKNIIHNYAAFEVSTIDGFTHRVLRTFAKDLDLPLNFEVELNTQEILQEAVDNLINRAGEDNSLTRVLVNFATGKADDDKSWDIGRDLLNIGRLLLQETSQPYLQMFRGKSLEDFESLTLQVKEEIRITEKECIKVANHFFDLLGENGIENKDFKGGHCPNFFAKLANKNFNVPFGSVWQQEISDRELYAKKLDTNKKEILDHLQPTIASLFHDAKQKLVTLEFLTAVEKNLTPLSLLSAIQNEISEIKKERSLVLISEFNASIGSAVKDQPAPFIYERLGEKYRHYFIDEFQDTSKLQWENLIPLVDHSLSFDHEEEETGSLTLVGDAKQSIYRWRGGKAEQFMNLCGAENPFSIENKKVVVLPNNFRSARQIVNFNNGFFTFSSQFFLSRDHQLLFEETSVQEPVKQHDGYVNISFIEAEKEEEEMERYPEKVLKIIRDLEQQNTAKSDICILTRRKKESIAIANYLSEHQVPVISAQSLLLSRSPEVNFINVVLQFALDGKDKNLKFRILDFLLERDLEVENPFLFLSQNLELNEQAFFAGLERVGIFFDVEVLKDLSVYEGVEYIIRSFNLVEKSNAYIQFYLDFVYESSQKDTSGIYDFLQLWEQKKDDLSIVVPKGEDAVQIMTIHKAKGLEFPIVIYPFANSKVKDTARESLWVRLPENLGKEIPVALLQAAEKMTNWEGDAPLLYEELGQNSQMDALNVLYVALTRPVHQLYVISKMELDKKGMENPNKFSGLLISYLRSIGKWDESEEYEFGNRSEEFTEEKTRLKFRQQEKFYSSGTEGGGISIITKAGVMWDSKQEMAIEKGQLIHDLFARINRAEDLEEVMRNAGEDGWFTSEGGVALKKTILKVLEHPELKKYFSEGYLNYNERTIIGENGEVLRPDRLNITGNRVTVIDYKTGEPSSRYQEQVSKYAAVLTGMGYEVEKRILIYVNEEVEVSLV